MACGSLSPAALLLFLCLHKGSILVCLQRACVCVWESACVYWLMPSRAVAWLKHLLTIKLSCAWWSRRVILCITPVPLPPYADTQSNRKMGIFVFVALRSLVQWAVFLWLGVSMLCGFFFFCVWVVEGQKDWKFDKNTEQETGRADRPDKYRAEMGDALAGKEELSISGPRKQFYSTQPTQTVWKIIIYIY